MNELIAQMVDSLESDPKVTGVLPPHPQQNCPNPH